MNSSYSQAQGDPAFKSSMKERYNYLGVEERLQELLGETYKKYRNEWRKAGASHVPDFPIHIDFELIDECNLRCGFCSRNAQNHPSLPYDINTKAVLSDELIGKILDEIANENLYSIGFGFGEPLLDKRIFDIIKAFHERGVIDSRITTNGIFLEDYIDAIFDSGLVNLHVSLDAFDGEMYKQIRGNSYDRAVDGLEQVLAERKRRGSLIPVVRVSFLDQPENHHQIAEFKAFWGDKVDFIDIQTYLDENHLIPSGNGKSFDCFAPFRRIAIIADESILPCCAFRGKLLAIGNIRVNSIREAWHSAKMAEVRHNLVHDLEPICIACQEGS